uniref:Reverse transcriptase domain-containing protein n=1 Tax=Tanacetum cinerariifolium TaxID=118510 RepID=A0A6L2KUQ2_TANCI|nr:reverse transcriptase domain-containing protein [Tanacetum cinerariifolium]
MADRTMKELLQAPTKGYGEAIVILEILAKIFKIKTNLLQLVQTNKFHGFERDNPHTHISNFKRMTSTLKYRDVPNDAIKLMLFSYSLEGAARIWYEKEPPNSILTWDDLIDKFVNQFFPSSKTTHLKNEISRFTQRFEETFREAWERFKKMLRACPHHGFSELTQIDTFYNGLNEKDQDSLNAMVGGNLLSKTTREALKIIENKSKVRYSRSKSNVSRVNMNSKENSSKTDDIIDKLADQISNLVEIVNKQVITPATAKAVEKTCVIYEGAHAYYDCIATDSNQSSVCAATGTYNQVSLPNRASNQIPPPGFAPVQNNQNRYNQNQGKGNNFNRGNNFQNNQGYRASINHAPKFQNQGFQNQPFQATNNHVQPGIPNELSSYMKSNESLIRNIQNQINVLRGDFNKQEENLRRNLNNDMRSILGSFFQNQASTSGILSSNTIPDPKGEMKAVTTHSGLAYEGPSIPTNSSPEKVVERETEEKTDKEHPNCQGSTAHIQPSVVPTPILEPDVSKTQPRPNIPYLSRLNDQKLREKATNQIEKFFQIFHDLHFDISFADALLLMPKFASTIKSLLTNKDKLFELAKVPLDENSSAMLLKKLLEKLGDPDNDRSITRPKGVAEDVFVKVGKFHFPTDFVVIDFEADPRVPLILGRSFLRTGHALIDVYGEEITLRVNDESVTFNLNQTMRYSSTYDDSSVNRVDVIDIACEEFVQDVLDFKYNSKSGNLTLEDILYLEKLLNDDPSQLPPMDLKQAEETKAKSSIEEPPELELKELPFYLEYDFLEEIDKLPEYYKPAVQIQRRVNPKIHDVIKKEIIKLLDAGMIYPISDIPWVSPIYCVPKKDGMTIVANENNELISTRLVTGWRVCIDYRKLNDATRKDHFPLPFMDQMLERLAENEFYCFLDGFSGYFQIPIDPQDQEKTTFTCSYGTFAYRRMPFGLCNTLGTFQSKQDSKPRLLRWVLLLQEFDITIRDKKGSENLAVDHLSRIENLIREQISNPTSSTNPNLKGRNRRCSKQRIESSNLEEHFHPVVTMADQRTMAESLRAPTEGDSPSMAKKRTFTFNSHLGGYCFKIYQLILSPSRTTNLHNEISNFQQWFDESFHEAWDRYKDLLHQDSMNASAGGNLLERSTQDVLTIIENRSKQTSAVTTAMTAMLKQFQVTHPLAPVKAVEETYVTCGGAHPYYQCLAAGGNTFPELRDNIHGYVSASVVNYNQGNLSYRPPGMANQIRPPGFAQPNVQNNQHRFGPPQGFNHGNEQSYQAPAQQNQNVHLNELEKVRRMKEANMKAMQTQIDMVKNELRNEMKSSIQTSFNTIANSKGELKAITTRSGLVVDGPIVLTPPQSINPKVDERVEETFTDPDLAEYTIKVPPSPQLHINITLADALILMPKYQKMLKALLSNKEKLQELANTPLNENYSAVIQKKLPEKLGDPGKFLISCGFSELKCKALADLGASINLMPLSVWKKLGLPELIPTHMTLELANRAICTLAGIARDVFVPVGKFTFPVDFVIVDYESDPRVPLILGRPFLRTARALIDVHSEEMILQSINLINVFNNSSNDFLEDLFQSQPSDNPTFSPHLELTSPEVNNDIFDSEGCNVLLEKLLDLDSTKDLHPPNPLSGSTTYFSNPLLEEFTDELPSKYDDNLQFDIESDLKEIEFLLYQDKDSSLKDLIDQKDLTNLADIFIDSIPEMFTDEHALDYSSPLIFDEYDDDLEVEFDAGNVYDDPFNSNGEKIKEVDALPTTNNEDKIFNPTVLIQEKPAEIITHVCQDKKLAISNPSLVLEDFDPPFYEPLFFK